MLQVTSLRIAWALRDLGISTELALDHDDSDADDASIIASEQSTAHANNGTSHHTTKNTQPTPASPQAHKEALKRLKLDAKQCGLASNLEEWMSWVVSVLGEAIPDARMSGEQVERLAAVLDEFKAAA